LSSAGVRASAPTPGAVARSFQRTCRNATPKHRPQQRGKHRHTAATEFEGDSPHDRAQPVRWSILKLGNRDWQLTRTCQALVLAFVFLVLTEQYFRVVQATALRPVRANPGRSERAIVRSSQATTHCRAAGAAGQRHGSELGPALSITQGADPAANAPIRAKRAHAVALRYRTFHCDSEA
jgi:hypothetical protein